MSEPLAIAIRGLSKSYRSDFWKRPHLALQGLDLDVAKGEIFGFIGPNGAGKTTTIKILVGLHAASAGTVALFGQPHDEAASRARLGFLPERPYFYQHLTARELLAFYGDLLGVDSRVLKSRVGQLLERVDLSRVADDPLGSYSKGMLQRVGLAQALLGDPDLVILDEPMSGLDPLGRALVRDIILEERDAGRTVFFSSHILHDVETLCSRVALLIGGQRKGVGTVAELIGDQVRFVELVVRGAADLDLPGERVRQEPSDGRPRSHWRVSPDQLDAAIGAVLAAGGQVLEATPVRSTLEDLFRDAVAQARPAAAPVSP